jgi:hypothetical protein
MSAAMSSHATPCNRTSGFADRIASTNSRSADTESMLCANRSTRSGSGPAVSARRAYAPRGVAAACIRSASSATARRNAARSASSVASASARVASGSMRALSNEVSQHETGQVTATVRRYLPRFGEPRC